MEICQQLRLTRAKKTLDFYISWYSLHPALPLSSSFAHLWRQSGTNFFARHVICNVRQDVNLNKESISNDKEEIYAQCPCEYGQSAGD